MSAGQVSPVGSIDQCDHHVVAGWIADRERPDEALLVDLYIGGQLCTTVLANLARKDLVHLGGGRHGFSIFLPTAIFTKWEDKSVQLRLHGDHGTVLEATISPDVTLLTIDNINDTGRPSALRVETGQTPRVLPSVSEDVNHARNGLSSIAEPKVELLFGKVRPAVSDAVLGLLEARKLYLRTPKFAVEKSAKIAPGGTVVTSDNRVLLETTEGFLSSQEILSDCPVEPPLGEIINQKIRIGFVERQVAHGMIGRAGAATAIQKGGWGNYAIWMTECLVRAFIATNNTEMAGLPLILKTTRKPGEKLFATFKESLAYLGYDESRLIIADERWTRMETLYVPTATDPRLQSRVSLELTLCCDEIRRRVETEREISAGKRIYVSRRDAKIRRAVNEEEIEELLTRRFGFEVHTLAGMRFADQVALFASASVVIGPHGAGLANCIFNGGQGTTLVEIATDDVFNRYIFRDICCVRGIRYGAVVGRMALREKGDFFVDPDDIEAAARWAIG